MSIYDDLLLVGATGSPVINGIPIVAFLFQDISSNSLISEWKQVYSFENILYNYVESDNPLGMGFRVGIYKDIVLISAKEAGIVYLYKQNMTVLPEIQYSVPIELYNQSTYIKFGYELLINEEMIVVSSEGAVFLFNRTDPFELLGSIVQTDGQPVDSNGRRFDIFGKDFIVLNDTIIISAHKHNMQGAVYVYNITTLTLLYKLFPSFTDSIFGRSIGADSSVLAISSDLYMHIYHHNGTSWVLYQTIDFVGSSAGDTLVYQNTILKGNKASENVNSYNGGIVNIYRFNNNLNQYIFYGTLYPGIANPNAKFGIPMLLDVRSQGPTRNIPRSLLISAYRFQNPIDPTGAIFQTLCFGPCNNNDNPCLNNGICCLGIDFQPICDCSNTIYIGDICNIDEDDCASNPCMNNHTCIDTGFHSFDCQCRANYEDEICSFYDDSVVHVPKDVIDGDYFSYVTCFNSKSLFVSARNKIYVYDFDPLRMDIIYNYIILPIKPTSTYQAMGASMVANDDMLIVGSAYSSPNDGEVRIYYNLSDPTLIYEFILYPSTPGLNNYFGYEVFLDYPWLIVGCATDSKIYAYDISFSFHTVTMTVTHSMNPSISSSSSFGTVIDGTINILFVGAPDYDSGAGCVVVFTGSDHVSDHILSPDGGLNDRFGSFISFSENIVAIQSSNALSISTYITGRIYIYEYSTTTSKYEYTGVSLEEIGIEHDNDLFGYRFYLQSSILVVISCAQKTDRGFGAGNLYIYEKASTTWDLKTTFMGPPIVDKNTNFQSISRYDNTLVIGLLHVNSGEKNGALFIVSCFGECINDNPCLNGGSCCLDMTMNPICNCTNTGFGGNYCEIPYPCDSSPCANNHVCTNISPYEFDCNCRNGYVDDICTIYDTSVVTDMPGGSFGDYFGWAIDTSLEFVAIGATTYGGSEQGAVFIFDYDTANHAISSSYTLLDRSTTTNYLFGSSLSLYQHTLAVSVRSSDYPNTPNLVGGVYIFNYDTRYLWTETQFIPPVVDVADALFGKNLQLTGTYLAISNDAVTNAFGIYVYELNTNWTKSISFGNSTVQFDSWNDVFVVGDNFYATNTGKVHIFYEVSPLEFTNESIITGTYEGDEFGYSVSVSNGILAIGAVGSNVTGMVFIYKENNDTTWSFSGSIMPPVANEIMFGSELQLYQHNSATFLSVSFGDIQSPGAVFIYLLQNNESWILQHHIVGPDATSIYDIAYFNSVIHDGIVIVGGVRRPYSPDGIVFTSRCFGECTVTNNSCLHGGSCCLDMTMNPICDCTNTGFGGNYCEIPICDSSPCANNHVCTNISPFDFDCNCRNGYVDDICSIYDVTKIVPIPVIDPGYAEVGKIAFNENKVFIGNNLHSFYGAVYIYDYDYTLDERSVNYTIITASDKMSNDYFGYDISVINGLLAVGAPLKGDNDTGGVYIYYMFSNEEWGNECIINPPASESGIFGVGLSLSENVVAIVCDSDVIYIYIEISSILWELDKTLISTSTTDRVYRALESRSDLLVAAFRDIGVSFFYSSSTDSLPSFTIKENENSFGVALSLYNTRLAVSANNALDTSGNNVGKVFLYHENNGIWEYEYEIQPTNLVSESIFTHSIHLIESKLAVVAGKSNTPLGLGSIYLYSETSTGWSDPIIQYGTYDINRNGINTVAIIGKSLFSSTISDIINNTYAIVYETKCFAEPIDNVDFCQNGGIYCLDYNLDPICDCTGTNFEGLNCSITRNPCPTSNCVIGQSSCIATGQDYTCQCYTGYKGQYCEYFDSSIDFSPATALNSVSMAADGSRIVIGDYKYNNNIGRVLVYDQVDSTLTNELAGNHRNTQDLHYFGYSVAIFNTGDIILVGVPGDPDPLVETPFSYIYGYSVGQSRYTYEYTLYATYDASVLFEDRLGTSLVFLTARTSFVAMWKGNAYTCNLLSVSEPVSVTASSCTKESPSSQMSYLEQDQNSNSGAYAGVKKGVTGNWGQIFYFYTDQSGSTITVQLIPTTAPSSPYMGNSVYLDDLMYVATVPALDYNVLSCVYIFKTTVAGYFDVSSTTETIIFDTNNFNSFGSDVVLSLNKVIVSSDTDNTITVIDWSTTNIIYELHHPELSISHFGSNMVLLNNQLISSVNTANNSFSIYLSTCFGPCADENFCKNGGVCCLDIDGNNMCDCTDTAFIGEICSEIISSPDYTFPNADTFGHEIQVHGTYTFVGHPSYGTCGAVFVYEDMPSGELLEISTIIPSVCSSAISFGSKIHFLQNQIIIVAESAKKTPQSTLNGALFIFDATTFDEVQYIYIEDFNAPANTIIDNIGRSVTSWNNEYLLVLGNKISNSDNSTIILFGRDSSNLNLWSYLSFHSSWIPYSTSKMRIVGNEMYLSHVGETVVVYGYHIDTNNQQQQQFDSYTSLTVQSNACFGCYFIISNNLLFLSNPKTDSISDQIVGSIVIIPWGSNNVWDDAQRIDISAPFQSSYGFGRSFEYIAGSTLVVAAHLFQTITSQNIGVLYVYQEIQPMEFSLLTMIVDGTSTTQPLYFGYSLIFSDYGSLLVVGYEGTTAYIHVVLDANQPELCVANCPAGSDLCVHGSCCLSSFEKVICDCSDTGFAGDLCDVYIIAEQLNVGSDPNLYATGTFNFIFKYSPHPEVHIYTGNSEYNYVILDSDPSSLAAYENDFAVTVTVPGTTNPAILVYSLDSAAGGWTQTYTLQPGTGVNDLVMLKDVIAYSDAPNNKIGIYTYMDANTGYVLEILSSLPTYSLDTKYHMKMTDSTITIFTGGVSSYDVQVYDRTNSNNAIAVIQEDFLIQGSYIGNDIIVTVYNINLVNVYYKDSNYATKTALTYTTNNVYETPIVAIVNNDIAISSVEYTTGYSGYVYLFRETNPFEWTKVKSVGIIDSSLSAFGNIHIGFTYDYTDNIIYMSVYSEGSSLNNYPVYNFKFDNNPCDPPCETGTCIEDLWGGSCSCDKYHTGKLCETFVDYCNPSQCASNEVCTNDDTYGNGYICTRCQGGSNMFVVNNVCHECPTVNDALCSGVGTCNDTAISPDVACICNDGYLGMGCYQPILADTFTKFGGYYRLEATLLSIDLSIVSVNEISIVGITAIASFSNYYNVDIWLNRYEPGSSIPISLSINQETSNIIIIQYDDGILSSWDANMLYSGYLITLKGSNFGLFDGVNNDYVSLNNFPLDLSHDTCFYRGTSYTITAFDTINKPCAHFDRSKDASSCEKYYPSYMILDMLESQYVYGYSIQRIDHTNVDFPSRTVSFQYSLDNNNFISYMDTSITLGTKTYIKSIIFSEPVFTRYVRLDFNSSSQIRIRLLTRDCQLKASNELIPILPVVYWSAEDYYYASSSNQYQYASISPSEDTLYIDPTVVIDTIEDPENIGIYKVFDTSIDIKLSEVSMYDNPTLSSIEQTKSTSIELWIKPKTLEGGIQVIFEFGSYWRGTSFTLNNNILNFNLADEGERVSISYIFDILPIRFISIIGTIDFENNIISLYVDQQYITEISFPLNIRHWLDTTGNGARVGNARIGAGDMSLYYNQFQGYIYDISIYNEVLKIEYIQYVAWNHEKIVSKIRSNGRNQVVSLTLNNDINNDIPFLSDILFDNSPPIIESILQYNMSSDILFISGNTLGKDYIIITGIGLGYDITLFSATIGELLCSNYQYIIDDNRIALKIPPGTGTNIPLHVYFDTQISNTLYIDYSPPIINTFSGCNGLCPSSGLINITITGENFGNDPNLINVYIRSWKDNTKDSCNNIVILNDSVNITCLLPAGFGYNVLTEIHVNGQITSKYLISYKTAVIEDNSLTLIGNNSIITPLGGQQLYFIVNDFPDGQTVEKILYGHATFNTITQLWEYTKVKHECIFDLINDVVIIDPLLPSSLNITCTLVPSWGKNLHFQIQYRFGVANIDSIISNDYFSFAAPIIQNGTLHDINALLPTGLSISEIQGRSTSEDMINFRGIHFSEFINERIIYYGPIDKPKKYICDETDPGLIFDNSITCRIRQGSGSNLRFTVVIGSGPEGQEDTGIDTYTYPETPVLTKVSGCIDIGSMTYDCPTSGLINGNSIILTITGNNFATSGLSITIGDKPCEKLTYLNDLNVDIQNGFIDQRVSCILPIGSGTDVAVTAVGLNGRLRGQPYLFVNYVIPSLTSVTGCIDDISGDTNNCDRNSMPTITLTGNNFGINGAFVLVGGKDCINVQHDNNNPHEIISCNLPSNSGLKQSVLILQKGGNALLSTHHVSYVECKLGQYSIAAPCEDCPVGWYTNIPNAIDCMECSSGSYNNIPASSSCLSCSLGKYASKTQASICTDCEVGKFINRERSSACDLCSAGSYTNKTGTITCELCPIGTYQGLTGQIECLSCPKGKYAPNEGSPECYSCNLGTYSSNEGSAICDSAIIGYYTSDSIDMLPCKPGSYSASTKASSCISCDPGKYVTDYASTVCLSCDIGTYTPTSDSSICLDCEVGKYSDKMEVIECISCPIGTYQNNTKSTSCKTCLKGSYSSNTESDKCDYCTPGKYNSFPGYFTCLNCDGGYYNNQTGSYECNICPTGKHSDPGSIECTDCLPGTHAILQGQQICSLCPLGYASNVTGAIECIPCEAGTYANYTGLKECLPCGEGSYSSIKAASCQKCSIGRYNNKLISGTCELCPKGTAASLTGQIICDICPPGKMSESLTGSTKCTKCDIGKYNDMYEQYACSACTSGKYSSKEGSTKCMECSIGKYQPNQLSSECLPCPSGTYTSFNSTSKCLPCDKGAYCSSGSSNYTLCAAGAFNPDEGQNSCDVCPAGKYTNKKGSLSCSSCLEGSYSTSNSSTCILCEIGKYTNSQEQTTCTECAAGKFTNHRGNITCENCPVGKSQSKTGKSECDPCSVGKYTFNQGKSQCDDCPVGYYTNLPEQLRCMQCELGKSQSQLGKSSCINCNPGFYTDVKGLKSCTPCPTGQWMPYYNASACIRCPEGKYAPSKSSIECILCPTGRSNSITGQLSCSNCPPGMYTDTIGNIECTLCPSGKYSLGGAEECDVCPPGTFNPSGASVCLNCEAGKYSNKNETSTCTACPAGKYQKDSLSPHTSCIDCSYGQYSPSNSPTCYACGATAIAPNVGSETCITCPTGTVPDIAGSSCLCNTGTYLSDVMYDINGIPILTCLSCPIGAVCDKKGMTLATIKSMDGWWRSNNDSNIFFSCILNEHCLGGENSACAAHREGPLCALCEIGYRSSDGKQPCEMCFENNTNIMMSIIYGAAIATGITLMYFFMLRMDKTAIKRLEKEDAAQLESYSNDVNDNYDDITNNGDKKQQLSREELFDEAKHLYNLNNNLHNKILDYDNIHDAMNSFKSSRAAPTITYQMKILISFLQVTTNLAVVVDVPWPIIYTTFMDYFNFVNLNFLPWNTFSCITYYSYYDKMMAYCALPFLLFICISCLFFLPRYLLRMSRYKRLGIGNGVLDSIKKLQDTKRERRLMWKFGLFTLFLIYPHLSATVIRFFVCRKVNDTYYLNEDFTLICYDKLWYSYLPYASIFILLYTIGIPTFFGYVLSKYRKRFSSLEVKLQLGFLYEPYEYRIWWFELLDMFYKVLMTSLVSFFPDMYQMPIGMIIATIYMYVVLLRKPYIRLMDEILHILCQLETLLLVTAGHLIVSNIRNGHQFDSRTDWVLGIILIILSITSFIVFISFFTYASIEMVRAYVDRNISNDTSCFVSCLNCLLKIYDKIISCWTSKRKQAIYMEDNNRIEFDERLNEKVGDVSHVISKNKHLMRIAAR